MFDNLGWPPLSQRRQDSRLSDSMLDLFYKIINGFAHVPFEGVLIEAYKGTARKHNMKCRQLFMPYGQSFFPKTIVSIGAWVMLAFAEALSFAEFRSNFGAFILEHVSEIMADICNNNYYNISCPPLSHLHVLK